MARSGFGKAGSGFGKDSRPDLWRAWVSQRDLRSDRAWVRPYLRSGRISQTHVGQAWVSGRIWSEIRLASERGERECAEERESGRLEGESAGEIFGLVKGRVFSS